MKPELKLFQARPRELFHSSSAIMTLGGKSRIPTPWTLPGQKPSIFVEFPGGTLIAFLGGST